MGKVLDELKETNLVYATYNVANALTDERITKVLDELRANNVAVAGIQEALPANYDAVGILHGQFNSAGYELHVVNNDDADNRLDARQTGLAIRHDVCNSLNPSVIRLATRNAWQVEHSDDVLGGKFTYYAAHFDDRSNEARQPQFDSFVRHHLEKTGGVAIGADFNVTHPNDPGARISQVLELITRRFQETQPTKLSGNKLTPGRLRSIGRRMYELTHSEQLLLLEEHGLHDSDPSHEATKVVAKYINVSLDRIMVSPGVDVLEQKVCPRTISDHSLVAARLALIAHRSV